MQNYWLSSINYQKTFIKNMNEKTMHDVSELFPAEKEFADSLLSIAKKYGKLSDYDGNGIYVGYKSGSENEVAGRGIKCGNCFLHQSENVCKIIKKRIEPNGLCRLAAIPDGLVKEEDDEEEIDNPE